MTNILKELIDKIKVLKNKEWNKVPETLKLYRNPGTNVEKGLLRRRTAEGSLWSSK